MNTEKIIEVLNGLKDYVNENWDEEYKKDIEEANEAVKIAVAILKSGKTVGSLVLNGKEYIVSERDN